MAKVTYRSDRQAWEVEVGSGMSLMQAAIFEGIDGIVGECGGNAMCATCHVYIGSDMADLLPALKPEEDEMLHCTTSPRSANSRLSCQIAMSDELDGLVVELPEDQ